MYRPTERRDESYADRVGALHIDELNRIVVRKIDGTDGRTDRHAGECITSHTCTTGTGIP